eukprot:scaffold2024_cov63-Phaeocystis_antarctica.AAC.3
MSADTSSLVHHGAVTRAVSPATSANERDRRRFDGEPAPRQEEGVGGLARPHAACLERRRIQAADSVGLGALRDLGAVLHHRAHLRQGVRGA